jgi:Xaa-Pro dipeptidase
MATSQKRMKKIFENIDSSASIKQKPDAVVLGNGTEPHLDASFFYVTGFPYGLFEGTYLLGLRDGTVSVITSKLEEPIARLYSQGIALYAEEDRSAIEARLRKLGAGLKLIGINCPELVCQSQQRIKSALRDARFVDVGAAFEEARIIKDSDEIARIQKACDISSATHRKIPRMLKEGVTESQVAAEMAYDMQSAGSSGLAFESIVGFGKNSAEPHYSPSSVKLKSGEFVLCDYGARYLRYCADITRTFVFGSASSKQRRMYEVIQRANELGISLCTQDNTGQQVHEKVAEYIDSTEFKGRFIHSTGHSLGISVHDGPGLSKNYKNHLKAGMVLTVEPGVYIPGFGGVRIEDDVVVTKGKPKVLTSAKHELIEV